MSDIPWTKEQMRDEMEFRGKLADKRRDDVARLTDQLEEALSIIKDLGDLHDSYIGYLASHNMYNQKAAAAIRERIDVLLLKQ